MPIDHKLFSKPAIRGDVSAVAVQVSIALDAVRDALLGLQKQQDITEDIKVLSQQITELDNFFDNLTGWKPSAD